MSEHRKEARVRIMKVHAMKWASTGTSSCVVHAACWHAVMQRCWYHKVADGVAGYKL